MGQSSVKHIAVITTSFPDAGFQAGQEAAGSFVHDFVEELSRHVQVTAIAPGSRTGSEQKGTLTIRRFNVSSLPLSLLNPTNPVHWPRILTTLRAGQRMVNDVVRKSEVDHLFALWALPSGYWARRAGSRYGIPYSVWALGSDIWSLGAIPFVRTVLRSVLRDSQQSFADGYQLADDVTALSGHDCKFLPSTRKLPVTEKKQLATTPPYKLAFLGRWHRHKGVDLLLESLHLLDEVDWQKIDAVQICGGGPLEELVYEQWARLQENGRPVTVGGYLDREEATELLMWSDYLLLPSRLESIPVIFSDALQTQCPIISTPIGDLPRLLARNHIGTLAQSVTAEAYARAIQQGLESAPDRYELRFKEVSKVFSLEATVRYVVSSLTGSVPG
jgi:glycosyltransferase involved in cell wall biosynthesis